MSPMSVALVVALVGVVGLARRRLPVGSGARVRRRVRKRDLSPPLGASASLLGRTLAPRLLAADLQWSPVDVLRIAVPVGGIIIVLAFAAGGPGLALVGFVVVTVAPPVALRAASGRRDARAEAELPALLESVAGSLRSGAALPAALREAATTGSLPAEELTAVFAEVDRGTSLGAALDGWVGRDGRPGVRLAVGAVAVARQSGGASARAIDGVAATLRERAEIDREVKALAAQARLSALIVTLAPLAFAAIGVLGDERTADFLLHTSTGLACLAAGLALDGLGAWWMARIAKARS